MPIAAARADEGIATDRPDFVESSDVVGRGRLQIETSIAGERSKLDGLRIRGLATPTLLRFGISEDVELRLETDGRLSIKAGPTRERGWADTAIGFKWHLQDGDESRSRPGVALLVHADLASGSGAFRGQGTRPSLRATFEWELADGYSFGLMPGLYQDRNDNGRRYTGGILAATLGKQLGENWRGFVEIAGQQLASAKNGGKLLTFDTGTTYLLSPSLQIDAAISLGLNKQSPDFQWTTGVSVKF